MAKIKVSELFYSLQGEGQYVGVPSIFLRTSGCNFTCGGFGMPRGQLSTERDKVAEKLEGNPLAFKDYKELPLVSTGCIVTGKHRDWGNYRDWETAIIVTGKQIGRGHV